MAQKKSKRAIRHPTKKRPVHIHRVLVQPRKRSLPAKITTKSFGLRVLEKVFFPLKTQGICVLKKRVYSSPDEFSLRHFNVVSKGRILVRGDIKEIDSAMSLLEWKNLPRKIFELNLLHPTETEKEVRAWMKERLNYNKDLVFIVHKVPVLSSYDKNIKVNVDLNAGIISITCMPARGEHFRFHPLKASVSMKINELSKRKGAKHEKLLSVLGSAHLSGKVLLAVSRLIEYAKKTSQPVFEASAVTYKANEGIEFYDLLFGKVGP
jgi:hypothetical protein